MGIQPIINTNMKHYILAGYQAVMHFNQEFSDYKKIAQNIIDGSGDIYEIASLDELSELLQQLVGWDDFITINESDVIEIKKYLGQ
jgi:hypothetical protein